MQLARATNLTWQDAIDLFFAERVDLAKTTKYNYSQLLYRFSTYSELPPDKIQRLSIIRFLQKIEDAQTYNYYLSCLKSFFCWFPTATKSKTRLRGLGLRSLMPSKRLAACLMKNTRSSTGTNQRQGI